MILGNLGPAVFTRVLSMTVVAVEVPPLTVAVRDTVPPSRQPGPR